MKHLTRRSIMKMIMGAGVASQVEISSAAPVPHCNDNGNDIDWMIDMKQSLPDVCDPSHFDISAVFHHFRSNRKVNLSIMNATSNTIQISFTPTASSATSSNMPFKECDMQGVITVDTTRGRSMPLHPRQPGEWSYSTVPPSSASTTSSPSVLIEC